tara:strand:- start:1363 stop:1884 length:522 start_codon:yes stop_codon:yes gene_type:complete
MLNIIKFITIAILVFIISIFYFSLNINNNYNTEYLIGKKLSEFKLKKLNDNDFFTSNDLKKNKYTLINFWASWCAPCRIEHPVLIKLSEDQSLEILGINFKDKNKNAINFLKDLGNPYDHLASDKKGKQSIAFGIYGIPESILVNNEMTVLKKFVGPLNADDFNDIKKIISSK